MKKTYFIKSVSFILIVIILLSSASKILKSKWTIDTCTSYVQEGMYDLEENSIELCFLGNSQMIFGVSSMILLENYGISAYNSATGLQPLLCTYFNLKEIHKTQDISTVVLDPSGLFEEVEDAKYRMVFDSSPMSLNKLQHIWEYCKMDQASDFWSYIFPIMQYHSRWSELERKDFKYKEMNNEIYRGNRLSGDVFEGIVYEELILENDKEAALIEEPQILEEHLHYFKKIVEYCKENNINLVLIKTPKSSWTKGQMEAVQALADEYGLDYLDFNEEKLVFDTGLDMKQDFKDPDHLNARGAEKLTNYLGEYLTSNYEFEDARKSSNYDEEATEAFYHNYRNKYITTAISVWEILDCINHEQYEILILKSGNLSSSNIDVLQEKLSALGVTKDMSDISDDNYLAYIANGQMVYEESSEEPLAYKDVFGDGKHFSLRSDCKNLSETPTIIVGEAELGFGDRGLNILVYDKMYQKIIRRFNLHVDPLTNQITLN